MSPNIHAFINLVPFCSCTPLVVEIRTKTTCHMIYIHFLTPRFCLWSLISQTRLCCNNNFWKNMALHQCCDLVCFDLIKFSAIRIVLASCKYPKLAIVSFPSLQNQSFKTNKTSSTTCRNFGMSTLCASVGISSHYNKRCPCMLSEFIRFWVNSLVLVNGD